MIEIASGSIFESGAEALVNPVNCVGVMGAGLAKQFKDRFPDNFRDYAESCAKGLVEIGRFLPFFTEEGSDVRCIINFPTKRHWKHSSNIHYIDAGLWPLPKFLEKHKINSVAIPALGCGLGDLKWRPVEELLKTHMSSVPQIRVLLYPPQGRGSGSLTGRQTA